eukprot:TRINITY_DN8722_c0_g1_i1.p1 TRINITY_DN8722_c0_g1~~TRINITY_DN8722_c0_g1_i1.p1  ORF type:complete len:148 (-),score=62.04 TRINITY_DN8722_c0_g1_i1:69-512(-)
MGKPETLLQFEMGRLMALRDKGLLQNNFRVLLMVYNGDKLIETTLAFINGVVDDSTRQEPKDFWLMRQDEEQEYDIFVDPSGWGDEELSFTPGGLSDDHQAYLNQQWRKSSDTWWKGEEPMLDFRDPNFVPPPPIPPLAAKAPAKKK